MQIKIQLLLNIQKSAAQLLIVPIVQVSAISALLVMFHTQLYHHHLYRYWELKTTLLGKAKIKDDHFSRYSIN